MYLAMTYRLDDVDDVTGEILGATTLTELGTSWIEAMYYLQHKLAALEAKGFTVDDSLAVLGTWGAFNFQTDIELGIEVYKRAFLN